MYTKRDSGDQGMRREVIFSRSCNALSTFKIHNLKEKKLYRVVKLIKDW